MPAKNGASGAGLRPNNEADGNRVIAVRRDADGRLSDVEDHPTGGRGDGVPH